MFGAVRRTFAHPVFLASFVLVLVLSSVLYITGKVAHPIKSDGWGYYLHLPAVFIYGDAVFAFVDRPEFPKTAERQGDGSWQGLSPLGNGGYLNKYPVGTAVLQAPFFLTALLVAKIALPRVTGLEPPFQFASIVSAAFFFALGLSLSYRTARLRYGVPASLSATGLAVLATNLLFYATVDGSYSHIYGFCLVAGICFLTVRRVELGGAPPWWESALFGGLLGTAVMVRPTNAVVGLLYLVLVRRSHFSAIGGSALVALAAAAIAALPQIAQWYVTTGHAVYYSYSGEGFRFLNPEISNYLFSIRKGVFFWHPAYLAMIAAAIAQIPRRPFEGTTVAVILALNLYIGASWHDYTFGSSFGCRQIVEMLPLLIVATAGAIEGRGSRWRSVATAGGCALVLLNAVNLYGIATRRLPTNDTTPEIYLAFLSDAFGLR
ncbi:hypothetical protein BH10PSE9_BH10PSE9_09770 [soil metagenome]